MIKHNDNTIKEPEAIVTEFFNRVWTPLNDLNAIDEMMTEDYTIISGGKEIKGREAFKAWVKEFQTHLLEARTVSQEAFSNATGSRVVSRWVCSGKNNGLFGLPADGRFISFTGIAIWKLRDGKFAECWVERSAFELYNEMLSGK